MDVALKAGQGTEWRAAIVGASSHIADSYLRSKVGTNGPCSDREGNIEKENVVHLSKFARGLMGHYTIPINLVSRFRNYGLTIHTMRFLINSQTSDMISHQGEGWTAAIGGLWVWRPVRWGGATSFRLRAQRVFHRPLKPINSDASQLLSYFDQVLIEPMVSVLKLIK